MAREKFVIEACQNELPAVQPICRGMNEVNEPRLTHFVDYVRFRGALDRAVEEVAPLLVQGFADETASDVEVTAGADTSIDPVALVAEAP